MTPGDPMHPRHGMRMITPTGTDYRNHALRERGGRDGEGRRRAPRSGISDREEDIPNQAAGSRDLSHPNATESGQSAVDNREWVSSNAETTPRLFRPEFPVPVVYVSLCI
jgi:hypothetical protein